MLTGKQKANRAYYAANAEKIKSQKRASYIKNKTVKPKKVKLTCKTQGVIKNAITSSEPAKKRVLVSAEDTLRLEARRRIEDFSLAKELGIEGF